MKNQFMLNGIMLILLLGFISACSMEKIDNSEMEQVKINIPLQVPDQRIAIKAYQFAYEPNLIEAEYGQYIQITITSIDVGHGFALPDFGINEPIPPEESKTFRIRLDKRGEFTFFNPVYSGAGWKNMTGKLVIR